MLPTGAGYARLIVTNYCIQGDERSVGGKFAKIVGGCLFTKVGTQEMPFSFFDGKCRLSTSWRTVMGNNVGCILCKT